MKITVAAERTSVGLQKGFFSSVKCVRVVYSRQIEIKVGHFSDRVRLDRELQVKFVVCNFRV